MSFRNLARRFLNSRRVRSLWQSDMGWLLIGLMPRRFKRHVKDFYRGVLTTPTQLPWSLQARVDPWDHNTPILSVVIPCYNYGRYIRETLSSLQSQSFRDFEIIIVDDGSEDELTLKVLRELREDGMQVFRQKKLNVAAALNLGIKASRGRYIVCLAADDTVEHTYFEKALCLLESNPGVAITYSLVKTFGDENRIWVTEPFDFRLLLEYNYICAAAVFRKAIWSQVGGFDEAMDGYEDWDFWLKAAEAGFRGRLIPETLFNYRRHGRTLNIRSDRRYQKLIEHIRANHSDFYSHLERTKEIASNYSDIRVPEPLVNLSSKAQYGNPRQGGWVIIASSQVAKHFVQSASAVREQQDLANAIIVETDHESWRPGTNESDPLTQIYHLEHFLDSYCWLDFVINLINTRSARFVLVCGAAVAYEWIPAIRSRSLGLTVSVMADDIQLVPLSAKYDRFIDLHVTLSEHIKQSLINDFGISAERIRSLLNVHSSEFIDLRKVLMICEKNQSST